MSLEVLDCILQKPVIEDTCRISPIKYFVVQITYTTEGGQECSFDKTLPSSTTEILFSKVLDGHPMKMTAYEIVVFAGNDGGLSEPSKISGECYVCVQKVIKIRVLQAV